MAENTDRFGLLKKDPVADGADTFNIDTMLNDNWDKLDGAAKKTELDDAVEGMKNYTDTAIEEAVEGIDVEPPVTSVNGQTGDVNLTADDVGAQEKITNGKIAQGLPTPNHGNFDIEDYFKLHFYAGDSETYPSMGLAIQLNLAMAPQSFYVDTVSMSFRFPDSSMDLAFEEPDSVTMEIVDDLVKVYKNSKLERVVPVANGFTGRISLHDYTDWQEYYANYFYYSLEKGEEVDDLKGYIDGSITGHANKKVGNDEVHGMRVEDGNFQIDYEGDWKTVISDIDKRIYGVRINKNNSNPETRVSYIGDAIGFTPMRGNNGNFSWGSWQEVFESFEIKPCTLQNGEVNYYLDPNDFFKKEDGSGANPIGPDGDVMIEFGKTLWWKWTDEGTSYTVEVSDQPFTGAVKHAFEIEDGYNLVPYYPLLLTQVLYVIFFRSTDSQTALGRGRVDGAGYTSTGNTNNKGMFYGSEADEQMKFLGIEDYWGNKFWWIDGLVTDANYDLLIGKGGFNDDGTDYNTYESGVSENMSGYISEVQGGNDKGFIIKASDGSETTHYADRGNLSSSRVAQFGGSRSSGSTAGAFGLQLSNSGSYSTAYIGARLFCASNRKIYIGAYLGTTVDGKLRSVSGAPEPTGSKTIGAFRAEAKANN